LIAKQYQQHKKVITVVVAARARRQRKACSAELSENQVPEKESEQ